ncbi:MAG: 2-amino-4-hydroxy-6-hydroxymethyldihydropteridine diphosphokinase [Gammaproteobacteria bacterium]|nr:MAG: 2-amino-4-hydroxy-6-hydroxymethyldihydropteridine diphosphokinase [Gammaproteobacteria bacterium]
MVRVYLSLGSNIERETHIRNALQALSGLYGQLVLSNVYESEAVGFVGDNFYNLVVGFDTDLPVGELQAQIKQIEDDNGRLRDGPKFSARTLDIDILTYGDFVGVDSGVQLPRDEITKNAFVLLPLSEIAGSELHPQLGESYQDLWAAYDKLQQKLWAIQL